MCYSAKKKCYYSFQLNIQNISSGVVKHLSLLVGNEHKGSKDAWLETLEG